MKGGDSKGVGLYDKMKIRGKEASGRLKRVVCVCPAMLDLFCYIHKLIRSFSSNLILTF